MCDPHLVAERDRLQAVVDAAREFVAARARWHVEAERSDAVPAVEFQRAYDDTMVALVDVIDQLDVSGPMGGSRVPITPDEIPQELIDILNRGAGKEHSRQGSVVRNLADILTRFREMVDAGALTADPPALEESLVLGERELTALKWAMGMPWFKRFADPATREDAMSVLCQMLDDDEDAGALTVDRPAPVGDGVRELGDDDAVVIKGVPYRIRTLRKITEDGRVPVVTLHAIGHAEDAPVGHCLLCSCTQFRPLPDDAELCVCDHVDDEHEEAGALIADREVTVTEAVASFLEGVPAGDDVSKIVAAKADGLRYVPPACGVCGRLHEVTRRFNSGDPIVHYEALCGCEDESHTTPGVVAMQYRATAALDDADAGALTVDPLAPVGSTVIPDQQGPAPAGDTRAVNPVAEQTGSPAPDPVTEEDA